MKGLTVIETTDGTDLPDKTHGRDSGEMPGSSCPVLDAALWRDKLFPA
jgi:hypothetical protein